MSDTPHIPLGAGGPNIHPKKPMTAEDALCAIDSTYATHGDPATTVERVKALRAAYDALQNEPLVVFLRQLNHRLELLGRTDSWLIEQTDQLEETVAQLETAVATKERGEASGSTE